MARRTHRLHEVETAQKITVALEDDLDGGPADETVRFGFEGADYEINLSSMNARRFRAQLTPFIKHGRKAGQDGLDGRRARRPAVSAAALSQLRSPVRREIWTQKKGRR